MTTKKDEIHKETLLKQRDSCEDKDDNEDARTEEHINAGRCEQNTTTTSGILASSAALLESIGNMKLRSRSLQQEKITQQKQQTSTILTSGFEISIDIQKDIRLLSPSLVRKKVKQDNVTNKKISDDESKSPLILQVQEQEGEPQQDSTNIETPKKFKQEEELVDEGADGKSSLVVKAESVVKSDGKELFNDKEEKKSVPIETEIQGMVLFTAETKNSEILVTAEHEKQSATKGNTTWLSPKTETTHKKFSSNTVVTYGGIETTLEASGPVTTVAEERLPSQELNASSPAKLVLDVVTNGATTSFTSSDTKPNSIDCKTTNYTNSNNIISGKPMKRRPYRRTKRPIGYNDRSSITVVNTVPGGKNSMSTVPLNVYDAILQESNDLMAAASEAQQLGRYKMASAYLRFLHARLVGLGKRFDTKRLKTQCQDRTTHCNNLLTNDTNNHTDPIVAHNAFSVDGHIGDESEKKFDVKSKSEAETDDGGNARDHADETKQEVDASLNDRRNRGTESDAVATLAKLFPNIPIDKTMYEHLKKAAAELHAARSISIELDPSPRTEVVPGINNRTDKGVGFSPLSTHGLIRASDNAPDMTSTTMTSIAWTDHEKQIIQEALASGERHPRRIAGLIPSRTEQQVKAYLHNQTQLARVEVDLDFLPQENTTASTVSASAATLAVLPRLDNDIHDHNLIQGKIEQCHHGNDKQHIHPILTCMTDVKGCTDTSNRKRSLSFVEEAAESKGNAIGKRKKAERKNIPTIEYSMSPYINLNQNVPDCKDDNATINKNDEGTTEVISQDMDCEDLQEQHKSKQSLTPLKRKGGRGKKPETAAVNTVPNAICNARALLQGTLLNSSSST